MNGANLRSVTECADQLDVDKSTISRYVARYPELNHGAAGAWPELDVEEVRQHRADNVEEARQNNWTGELMDGGGESDTDGAANLEGESFKEARTRKERAAAAITELDLSKKLDLLLSRAGAESAFQDAGQQIRQALAARNRALGDKLANETDPRAIATILNDSDREMLTRLAASLADQVGLSMD